VATRRKKRPVSDTEYTGLADTAVGFSGSSTLDLSVDPGSTLALVTSHVPRQTANNFTTSTYDLWDNENPQSALQLSGVSDPPFESAGLSTPLPVAAQPAGSVYNSLKAQSKYGSGIATLLGNHPTTVNPVAPSVAHGPRIGAVTVPAVPSTHLTIATVVIIVAIICLLANGAGGELG
jgi:hypothetical protein